MLDDAGLAAVGKAVRAAGDEVVVPLFGALAAGDIEEKTPGEMVTIADRRAEEFLARELTRIVPGSRVVGEEGVHADPGVLALLSGPEPVWIIDPIDGTEAFATGSPRVLDPGHPRPARPAPGLLDLRPAAAVHGHRHARRRRLR
jgi:fructose-1,6-bisphosphatase/inositol monophosphatase family enzyme